MIIFLSLWSVTFPFIVSGMKCEVTVVQLCPTLWDPIDHTVHGILQARILEWVAIHFSRIFPTQRSNPGLPHCRWILYQRSYQGSPRTLEWVAYPFSRGSSRPRNWTGVPWTAGGFFTSWATREALYIWYVYIKESNFPTYSNMNGLGGHYAKWNKSEKDKYCTVSLTSGI